MRKNQKFGICTYTSPPTQKLVQGPWNKLFTLKFTFTYAQVNTNSVYLSVAWLDDFGQWRQFLLNSWCVRNLPECCASRNRHDERKQLALHFRMMMVVVVVMIMLLVMMIMDGWFLRNLQGKI